MKPKINPEDYRKILKQVELKSVFLSNLSVDFQEDSLTQTLGIDIKEKGSFTQVGKELKVLYKYKFSGKDKDKPKAGLIINAEFMLVYTIEGDTIIQEDFFEIFREYVVNLTIWPYYRELVSNLTARMNLPALLLPMKKL